MPQGSFQASDGTSFDESSGVPSLATRAPLTGTTVVMGWNERTLYLKPAGTLAALTINLPKGVLPGEMVMIITTQTITALTLNDGFGVAVPNGHASLNPNTEYLLWYSTVTDKWVPLVPPNAHQDAFNTNTATANTTLTAANITGAASEVYLALTGTLGGAANAQLPTVAAMLAAMQPATIGASFGLRIINRSSGAFAWTVTTNTGWTLNGTMSIAQNTWRDFVVTVTGSGTATLQAVGTGTDS